MHLSSSQTQRALCNSLKNLKRVKDHTLVPDSGHKPSDPGHSSNTFHLDSLWPRSSPSFNRFLPGVTGEFHQLKITISSRPKRFCINLQKSWPKTMHYNSKNINTSKSITIWHACSKPPKIEHAKYLLAMCYSFFFIIMFQLLYRSVNPWGTCFTWSHPRCVAFQFNQKPLCLLRYRHLTFPRSISLRQTTHRSKTSSGLKD